MHVQKNAKRRLLSVSLVVISVCAWNAHASAQGTAAQPEYLSDDPGERDKQAHEDFEQGKKAYENGEYREAWAHFHDAYQLSGRPELLYNIGQTADRLGMDADALKAFRLYLERLPDAANRREVENRVRALEDRVAQRGDAPAAPANDDKPKSIFDDADTSANGAAVPPPPSGGQPRRQGWYFRGGLGLGLRRDGVSGGNVDGTLSGAGLSLELALGITLLPGLVVGGGLFVDTTSRPTLSLQNAADTTLNSSTLSVVGPMADWYLRHESDGWHLQAALGLALLSFSRGTGAATGSPVGSRSGTGGSLLIGGGYEWPIADDWGLGVLGRFTFAGVSEDTFSHGIFTTSVLASVTWY